MLTHRIFLSLRLKAAVSACLMVPAVLFSTAAAHADPPKNAAAVQIQGTGVTETTKSWSQNETIAGSEASRYLDILYSAQTRVQKARVNVAYGKVGIYVSYTCPVNAGCTSPGKSGTTNPGVSGSVARVDSPVYRGRAFV
jgi:hypothetical protein